MAVETFGGPPPAPSSVVPIRPTYVTRQLPPEEWERLRDLPFAANGLPDPETTLILVDEIPAGEIVGIWALFLQPFLDGLWVHPEHRHTVIAGQLLREMKALLQAHGITTAFTVVSDPAVMTLAYKAGFARAPGDLWLLQLQPPAGASEEEG